MESICQQLAFPPSDNTAAFKTRLSLIINEMIDKDFNRLILVLYRFDIDESKLRRLLGQHTEENAADTIAEMILNRQLEKQKSRENFRRDEQIDENEKW